MEEKRGQASAVIFLRETGEGGGTRNSGRGQGAEACCLHTMPSPWPGDHFPISGI